MGAVYLAKQVSLDREVAVKILPRELSADPEFRASFQTEARAMARLNHPNLIGIYDSGDVDGMLYIAMEYVPGKSLYHSSWNKKIDPAEASRIVIAICEGLSHAHENGIIHRDIKPANILLTPKIEPKIGDFGLAQATGIKNDGIAMGTPGYAAPEVISRPEKADRRADLFAVGVILHELLTGQKPAPHILPSSLCKCGKEFDALIQRATHPNPVMRYPDATAMANAIREAIRPNSSADKKVARPAAVAAARPQPMARPAAVVKTPVAAKTPATPATEEEDADELPLPALVVSSGNASWSYVRNLLIIAALAVVLVFVYQKLQIHKKEVAAREQAYNNKQKEEAMRRRREAEEEMARINTPPLPEPETITPVTPITPPVAPVEEKKETAMESLERLQYDLSKGSRDEMPMGSKRRGEMDFFLVPEPMSWDAALLFAEKHGAHIALPTNADELTFLASLLKNNETIWLGAGRSGGDQWILLDGSLWSMEKTPPGIGNYATLSHLGNVRAGEAARAFPFVMAWHRDGSNPSSLANLLQATRKSLDTHTPLFPPGTEAAGARYYLPILRPMNRVEAYELAQQAGAHVAALSNKEEGYWVTDHLSSLSADRGIWIGGEKVGGVWEWSTKEPWTYAQWAAESPDENETATLLVYLPKKGWHNVNKEDQADGVLLEWSKDPEATASGPVNMSGTTTDIAALVTKCRTLLASSAKERNDKLAANVKSFNWDLDVWLRSLKPVEKMQWQMPVDLLKRITNQGRIPSAEEVAEIQRVGFRERDASGGDAIPVMHPSIVKIHTYSLTKQTDAETAYQMRNEKIRDSYLLRLREMGASAQKSGQQDLARQLKVYFDEANELDSWVKSMLGE